MSRVGPETDDSTDGANLPGDSSGWDEEWLPEWVNVEDDVPAPEQPEPELEEQLAADLEAVQRLVASLLTESSAAFEASVGGWEPDEHEADDHEEPDELEEPKEPPAPVAPVSELSSVGFSLGVARPVPAPVPLPERPPVPAVVSPSAPRRRRWGWLVAPMVLLLAGAVIGMFMWAGSSGRPTPAAAVRTDPDLSSTSALPTWTRPADSEPTGPVPVTTSASSTSAPVTSAPRVHRPAPRPAAHTSAAPTVAPQHLVAPSIAVPPPSPTGTGAGPDSTNSSGSPSCSAANTDSTPTQTTDSTATSTATTTATQTSTLTTTATDTSTPTLGSQPSLAPAVSCSN